MILEILYILLSLISKTETKISHCSITFQPSFLIGSPQSSLIYTYCSFLTGNANSLIGMPKVVH